MPSLLAVIPHPDDESYSFGGLLALASGAGWTVHALAATSGEGGERHDGGPPGREALATAREAELSASCAILGCEPPIFLRLPDGGLNAHRKALAAAIITHAARLAPDLALTLGPDGAYGHPDHLAVHEAVTRAFAASGTPVLVSSFPRGLFLPQYEKCVAAGVIDAAAFPPDRIGTADAAHAVDISFTAHRKLAAIAAHRTQLPGGDPRALFPPGIVDALLVEERFCVAGGALDSEIAGSLGLRAAAGSREA